MLSEEERMLAVLSAKSLKSDSQVGRLYWHGKRKRKRHQRSREVSQKFAEAQKWQLC